MPSPMGLDLQSDRLAGGLPSSNAWGHACGDPGSRRGTDRRGCWAPSSGPERPDDGSTGTTTSYPAVSDAGADHMRRSVSTTDIPCLGRTSRAPARPLDGACGLVPRRSARSLTVVPTCRTASVIGIRAGHRRPATYDRQSAFSTGQARRSGPRAAAARSPGPAAGAAARSVPESGPHRGSGSAGAGSG